MMNILTIIGMFGVIGTVGALDCGVIGMTQAVIQLMTTGAMTLVCFYHSDFIA